KKTDQRILSGCDIGGEVVRVSDEAGDAANGGRRWRTGWLLHPSEQLLNGLAGCELDQLPLVRLRCAIGHREGVRTSCQRLREIESVVDELDVHIRDGCSRRCACGRGSDGEGLDHTL